MYYKRRVDGSLRNEYLHTSEIVCSGEEWVSDLPGPEKAIDWKALLRGEMAPATAPRLVAAVKRVRPRHRMVVMLGEAGWKNNEIARATGYTEARISVIRNSRHPALQELKAKFASQVADNILDTQTRFKLYANEMLDILVRHARNAAADPGNSRLAARDLLHMAGFTPVKKVFAIETRAPIEEIRQLVQKVHEANEVVLQHSDWVVKEVKTA